MLHSVILFMFFQYVKIYILKANTRVRISLVNRVKSDFIVSSARPNLTSILVITTGPSN